MLPVKTLLMMKTSKVDYAEILALLHQISICSNFNHNANISPSFSFSWAKLVSIFDFDPIPPIPPTSSPGKVAILLNTTKVI